LHQHRHLRLERGVVGRQAPDLFHQHVHDVVLLVALVGVVGEVLSAGVVDHRVEHLFFDGRVHVQLVEYLAHELRHLGAVLGVGRFTKAREQCPNPVVVLSQQLQGRPCLSSSGWGRLATRSTDPQTWSRLLPSLVMCPITSCSPVRWGRERPPSAKSWPAGCDARSSTRTARSKPSTASRPGNWQASMESSDSIRRRSRRSGGPCPRHGPPSSPRPPASPTAPTSARSSPAPGSSSSPATLSPWRRGHDTAVIGARSLSTSSPVSAPGAPKGSGRWRTSWST